MMMFMKIGNRFILLSAAVLMTALPPSTALADGSGLWRGRWTSDARPDRRAHGGTLNVRLRPGPGQTYRGLFYGRFAGLIPYAYRAEVVPIPGGFYSSRRLGRSGRYQMVLQRGPSGRLDGSWTASMRNGEVHTGAVHLHRRR